MEVWGTVGVFVATSTSIVVAYLLWNRDERLATSRARQLGEPAAPTRPAVEMLHSLIAGLPPSRTRNEPHMSPPLPTVVPRRRAVAAVEFCIVAGVLFVLVLGMIELSRAMMVLGAVAHAARCAARAGAISPGTYSDATQAARTSLAAAGITATPTVTVTVNGAEVTDDDTFRAAATAGKVIAVKVSVLYANVSWLPAGSGFFLSASQSLSESASQSKEG